MAKRSAPEVNAGSMADIAFLLLIFFLVTTTIETDKGINSKLPPIEEDIPDPPPVKEKNIFLVLVNGGNQLFVEDDKMEVTELREEAIKFLDNGGGAGSESCDYCQGNGDPKSSDNPVKAIISLQNDRETDYSMYISVRNELTAAYNFLRDREANRLFGTSFRKMEQDFDSPDFEGNKAQLEENIKVIREMFPMKLSEAEPKKRN